MKQIYLSKKEGTAGNFFVRETLPIVRRTTGQKTNSRRLLLTSSTSQKESGSADGRTWAFESVAVSSLNVVSVALWLFAFPVPVLESTVAALWARTPLQPGFPAENFQNFLFFVGSKVLCCAPRTVISANRIYDKLRKIVLADFSHLAENWTCCCCDLLCLRGLLL